MTKDIWFISDTHFGHEACCTKFLRKDGTPLRPFASAADADEAMVERWNARVKPQDKVYHLGDVVIGKRHLATVGRLNGHKRLVRGNHDIFEDKLYREHFDAIYGVRVFVDDFILSHIPLHPDSVTARFKVNVHGHYHANEVMMVNPHAKKQEIVDPRYMSVCVEHLDYAPIHIDDLRERIRIRQAA